MHILFSHLARWQASGPSLGSLLNKAEVAEKRKLASEAEKALEAAHDDLDRLQNDNSEKDEALKVAHRGIDRLVEKNSVMDAIIRKLGKQEM
jgi:hypothetical protein